METSLPPTERSLFMPGFTTHYFFGVRTFQNLEQPLLKNQIKKYHTAFGLGLQGPDIFFYDLPSYALYHTNIGSSAHTKDTGKFLSFLLKSRKLFSSASEIQIAESYIAGFIGHYLLDTACHPYIYCKSGNLPEDSSTFGAHVYLEVDIDNAFLWHYKKLLPSEFRPESTIHLTPAEHHVIAKILHYCYKNVYPELSVSLASTYRATFSTPFLCSLLRDSTGKKKALARMAEKKILGYPFISPLIPSDSLQFYTDPLNLSHCTWTNPWDTTLSSSASFPELFLAARKSYQTYLSRLSELFSCKKETLLSSLEEALLADLGNKSYHSGLDCSIPS